MFVVLVLLVAGCFGAGRGYAYYQETQLRNALQTAGFDPDTFSVRTVFATLPPPTLARKVLANSTGKTCSLQFELANGVLTVTSGTVQDAMPFAAGAIDTVCKAT